MQHLPLFPRQLIRSDLLEEAPKLQPMYKLKPARVRPLPLTEDVPGEFSSPVCYAHLKDFREGFED